MDLQSAIAEVTAPGKPYETITVHANGVDYPAFKNAPQNLRELYRQGLRHKDRILYVYESDRYTFEDCWDKAAAVANQLRAAGFQHGDRVGVALRNYPEWVFTFMGITSMGGVAVALNAWWSSEELEYGITDSGLKLLFADEERVERIRDRADALGVQLVSVRSQFDGIQTFEQFMSGASTDMPEVPVEPEDYATLMYTSGSTAHPKGVVSTHRAITNALLGWECSGAIGMAMMRANQQVQAQPAPQRQPSTPSQPPPQPSMILSVPLFHVTGLTVQLLQSFRGGRKLVGMYKWDVEKAFEIIETEQITSFNGVPTMAYELVQSPNREKYNLSSLKSAGGGGAPMAPEQARQIDEKIGHGGAGTGWGMTETQGLATGIGGDAFLQRPRSCGRAVPPLVKVKAIDDDGNDLGPGETGELCIWGVMNFSGYWNRPDETAETLVDGWVRTGDVGHLDHEGYVFITDRKKDMVLRGGENIGCQEVEAVLYEHPAVAEACVFGVPDTRLGETLATVVCRKPGASLYSDEIRAFVRQHLAHFKVPDHIWIRDERLPRTASEKIYKRMIRNEALEQLKQGETGD